MASSLINILAKTSYSNSSSVNPMGGKMFPIGKFMDGEFRRRDTAYTSELTPEILLEFASLLGPEGSGKTVSVSGAFWYSQFNRPGTSNGSVQLSINGYLDVTPALPEDFYFPAGTDFTIEMFLRGTPDNRTLMDIGVDKGYVTLGSTVILQRDQVTILQTGGYSFSLEWNHFVITREGEVWRIYVNGTRIHEEIISNQDWGVLGGQFTLGNIGSHTSQGNGFIYDGIRVIKGVSLYSDPTIVVPAGEYPPTIVTI